MLLNAEKKIGSNNSQYISNSEEVKEKSGAIYNFHTLFIVSQKLRIVCVTSDRLYIDIY